MTTPDRNPSEEATKAASILVFGPLLESQQEEFFKPCCGQAVREFAGYWKGDAAVPVVALAFDAFALAAAERAREDSKKWRQVTGMLLMRVGGSVTLTPADALRFNDLRKGEIVETPHGDGRITLEVRAMPLEDA